MQRDCTNPNCSESRVPYHPLCGEHLRAAEIARFWTHVADLDHNGCMVWMRPPKTNGYGQFRSVGKVHYPHRFAYEALVGPIPDGLTIDHLCFNRLCCNPDHMEMVTAAENTRRNRSEGMVLNRAGHCRRGHPKEPGAPTCRACGRERHHERKTTAA